MAGKDDYSSDEEDDSAAHKFRKNFTKTDPMKLFLESKFIVNNW